ncbi:MAG: ABC transporter substrate-binding protein [Spirochaetes bacterium]|nr:ABC transporter substrate-binding protein [Spirochaetota bacterium]
MKKLVLFVIFFNFSFYTFANSETNSIKIAAIYARDGIASVTGNQIYEALHYWANNINQKGGILNRKLEIVEYNHKSSPLMAKVMARKAIEDEVTAVIGCGWSTFTLVVAKELQNARIPMITPYSTHVDITQIGDYIFRICYDDLLQSEVLAKLVYHDLNAKKAAVLINTNQQYSIDLAGLFDQQFQKLGGQIVYEGDYVEKQTNYEDILSRMIEANPDICFIPGYAYDSSIIIKQAKRMDISITFLGSDGWNSEMYQYAADEIIGYYYTTHTHIDSAHPVSQQIIKDFQILSAVNNIDFTHFSLIHDAVYLLADAINRTGSLNRQEIRNQLAETRNFPGATGTISMNSSGNPLKPILILQFGKKQPILYKMFHP